MKIDLAACTLATTLALSAAFAQAAQGPVWRCGNDYSDRPCAQGQALALDDAHGPAQLAAARQAAAQDRQLAARLVRERERRERLALAQNALPGSLRVQAALPARQAAAPRPQAKRQPLADGGTWRAAAPASPRARD